VKNAHEGEYSCRIFQEMLGDYIDGELPENEKSLFLAHSLICSECSVLLNSCKSLRKKMAVLPKTAVSSRFDFELRNKVRREQIRMQSPMYRIKLWAEDNIRYLITVPTTAAVLTALFLTVATNRSPQKEMTTELAKADTVHVEESQDEIIRYVLDSVDSGEAEHGIFLNEQAIIRQASSTDGQLSLVKF